MDRGTSLLGYGPCGGKKLDTTASEHQMMEGALPHVGYVRTVRTLMIESNSEDGGPQQPPVSCILRPSSLPTPGIGLTPRPNVLIRHLPYPWGKE